MRVPQGTVTRGSPPSSTKHVKHVQGAAFILRSYDSNSDHKGSAVAVPVRDLKTTLTRDSVFEIRLNT